MVRPVHVIGQNPLPTDLEQSKQDIKGLDFSWEEGDRLIGTDYRVDIMWRKRWSLSPLDGNSSCIDLCLMKN